MESECDYFKLFDRSNAKWNAKMDVHALISFLTAEMSRIEKKLGNFFLTEITTCFERFVVDLRNHNVGHSSDDMVKFTDFLCALIGGFQRKQICK